MINKIIHKYIKDNITPKQSEKDDASIKYGDLTNMLKGVNLQSGSFARFTAITPINDLDVIWELPKDMLLKKFSSQQVVTKTINPTDLDVSNILSDLAVELTKEYSKKAIPVMKISPRSHSVCIYFGPTEEAFSIDIVPAVPSGINEYGDTTYWVPEIAEMSRKKRNGFYKSNKTINWIKSDPRGYIKEATELNDKTLNYRHVVKFCKKWKWAIKQNFPDIKFKSFHIEMVVKELFYKNINLNTLEGIKLFFTEIKNYLAKPQIKDRADSTKFIDDYLTELTQETKNKTINEGFKAVKILEDLSTETNQSIIEQKINQIFIITVPSQSFDNRTVSPISRPYAS